MNAVTQVLMIEFFDLVGKSFKKIHSFWSTWVRIMYDGTSIKTETKIGVRMKTLKPHQRACGYSVKCSERTVLVVCGTVNHLYNRVIMFFVEFRRQRCVQ